MTQGHYKDLPFGITTIDTGYVRPGFAASHLIIEGEEAAFVDVGTSHSTPALLAVLAEKNIPPEQVAYVMVTHIHLDHAGGAGELMKHLKNAKLIVHPRGKRHMADPTKLIASATAVYGEEEMTSSFGTIVPVPEERIIEAPDGFHVNMNGREFLFLDTPGHARHHYCVVDEKSRGIFSGDTFGLSYRDFDTAKGPFIFPTTTPTQFDPEAMHASIDRLMAQKPKNIYLTHYGQVHDLPQLADYLHQLLDRFVTLANDLKDAGENRINLLKKGIEQIFISELGKHGCKLSDEQTRSLLAMDIHLNAQGIDIWLDAQKKDKNKP